MEYISAIEEVKSKSNVSCQLRKESVTYKLIIRQGGNWLGEISPNHDGRALFTNCCHNFRGVPTEGRTGRLVNPLTEDEMTWFYSKESGLNIKAGSLSPFEKESFWNTFTVKLSKEGMTLDLSNPLDYLKNKFLLAQRDIIAPSWEQRFDRGTYLFAAISETHEVEQTNIKAEKLEKAYSYFTKMKGNSKRMKDILRIEGRTVAENSNVDFMRAEIQRFIDTDIDKFLFIVDDKDFNIKLLIEEAISIGEIFKKGKGNYVFPSGQKIGVLSDVVEFFKDPLNSDVKIKIQSRIDAAIGNGS